MYNKVIHGFNGIYAKVVKDSISKEGVRLVTLETRAPKFVDAEFEKHRMLSSNSSSSRAIPTKRVIDESVYLPFDVRENQSGMVGAEQLNREELGEFYSELWAIRETVTAIMERWSKVHKQTINRYLEPFMYQHKVVTATEWNNFFDLRLAPNAQPEIRELARCMKDAMDESTPTPLKKGKWHLPYTDSSDAGDIWISAARCARVSYSKHDGARPSRDEDMKLARFLKDHKHMTPFEHQAEPMEAPEVVGTIGYITHSSGISHIDRLGVPWSGNFRRWTQYRKVLELIGEPVGSLD